MNDLNEIKHHISPYFDVTDVCAVNSILDFATGDAYFNYAQSSGSIYTFVVASSVNNESLIHFEIREMSLLSKIFSGFIQRQRSIEYSDLSVMDMTYVELNKKIYLVTISKDNKLKIWSLKDRTCTVSEDLLPFVLESNDCNRSLTTINQNSIISSHKIKSFYSNTNIDDYIDTVVVYFHIIFGKITFSNWIVLRVMDPSDRANYGHPIQILSNINNAGDNLNLLDYQIGYDMKKNDIIGVWSLTAQSNAEKSKVHSLNWVPLTEDRQNDKVICQLYNASNELELPILNHQDTQEAVLTKIFTPHIFSRMAIINTINRYIDDDNFLVSNTDIDELKYRLNIIVESKVDKKIAVYLSEDSDIDLLELNRDQWNNIFQEIVEEHFSIMEPYGIFLTSGTIGLNRFGSVTLMRRANCMEQILSSSSQTHLKEFYDDNNLTGGSCLLKHIYKESLHFQSLDSWPMIEYSLLTLGESPIEICHKLSSSSSSFNTSSINSHFDNQPHLLTQTIDLLEKLDIDYLHELTSNSESSRLSLLSMGMLHYTTCQVVRDRICVSVALLNMLIQRSPNIPQGNHLDNLVDRLVYLVKSLVSVFWLLTIRQRNSLELTDVQKTQLSSLNLLESRSENNSCTDIFCIRVLQLLQGKCTLSNYQSHNWQSKMSTEIIMIINYLYPNSDSFPIIQISKYFLSYNMPLELIDYLKMITKSQPKGWWEGDYSLVNVIIGVAYLILNKPWKTVQYVIEALRKPELSSSLLPDIILNEDVRSEMDCLCVLQAGLFIKIISVIENIQNSQPYIITMANVGIDIINEVFETSESVTKYKSILLTILFKNLLELKKYDEARTAITDNPDVDKQKDCLRQFVMVLFEQNELSKLVHFDYGHLNEEFINIVTSHARASDITTAGVYPFYNVEYSFHVRHGDMKSAATSMLALALRLDSEMKSRGPYLENSVAIELLQHQIKAYLACITSSSLLPKEDQLFVFPAILTEDFDVHNKQIINKQQKLSKHDCSDQMMEVSEATPIEEGTKRNIINLSQIRRQYNLIKSRLKLLRESPEHGFVHNGKLTPSLTLASLLQIGLYYDAIKICQDFQLDDMSSIIATIAQRCAQISKNCLDRPLLKEKENVIDSLEEITTGVDFASFGSLQKLMWRLLDEVLGKYDKSPHGDLYIKACSKLLSSGIEQLPSWLVNCIMKKNSYSSLLRLYIMNGLLEPAVNLACRVLTERIDEIQLLKGDIDFQGLQCLHKRQTKWISYPSILHLLEILTNMNEEEESDCVKDLFDKLNDKLKTMATFLQLDTTARRAITSS